MAKIVFDFSHEFVTDLLIVTEDFSEVKLDVARSSAFFSKCPGEDLAIYVVGLNKNLETPFVGFEVLRKHGSKSSLFDIVQDAATGKIHCRLKGKFTLALRSGVAEDLVEGVKFAIQGVCYKGGSYRGFMAYVEGQTEGEYNKWLMFGDGAVVVKP